LGQDFATTIRKHVRAFKYFGGLAATCLYDNIKVVVTGYDGDQPIYNTPLSASRSEGATIPGLAEG
jgi:transposase